MSKKIKFLIGFLIIIVLGQGWFIYSILSSATGPFGLPVYNFYSAEDYIGVTGSWVADSDDAYFKDFPIQTSEINCYKSRGFCFEARALKDSTYTGHLLASLLEYEIKSWEPNKVVAVLDGRAATIELTFDTVKKVVTFVRSEKAEIEGAAKLPSYAHMDDGQKAIEFSKKKK